MKQYQEVCRITRSVSVPNYTCILFDFVSGFGSYVYEKPAKNENNAYCFFWFGNFGFCFVFGVDVKWP